MTAPEQPTTTAYEPCSRCRGYGIIDDIDGPRDCPECRGDCYVRARDSHGRFTTIELA